MAVVEFRSRRPEDGAIEVIGRVSAEGREPAVAVGVDAAGQAYLDRILEREIDGPDGRTLTAADGKAFVAALPDEYRGSSLWAARVSGG